MHVNRTAKHPQILTSPTSMPRSCGFLWNKKMMIQVNCRGFAKAQHMQPEPGKYAYAPNLEGTTFMQPEQPYYAHHPGRFVYIKDEADGRWFSAPYEPVRRPAERFEFIVDQNYIAWNIKDLGIEVEFSLSLPAATAAELWTLKIRNGGSHERWLSVYPFFTIGYMSWMNQSACYRQDLGGIVASCVTPYQKVEDYERIRSLKDKTCLLHDTVPVAWEARLEAFEGEGGLHRPDALLSNTLAGGDALYEMPVAALQYRITLAAGSEKEFRFVFGPARDDAEIDALRGRYLAPGGFEQAGSRYQSYLDAGAGCLRISTPDAALDDFVNHWLARQVYYHGDVNRLSTDPQTRNYLQDAMGMAYIQPHSTRNAFLLALSQQDPSGAMPDGIRLHNQAELKYINQVPHTDHCVWLPVCLQAYLDETGDYPLLEVEVTSEKDGSIATVFERITQAMDWLDRERDPRGLSYIAQGDWCDPMNMVGHKGRGVSAWLSIATVYALRLWSRVCVTSGRQSTAQRMQACSDEMSVAIQQLLWDGNWFARGITDDDVVFGVSADQEGRIFLNPQSWAIMAGISNPDQNDCMLQAVEELLETPFGVMMLAPAYTAVREDIGRVTQKYPGSAENGSVYNHAAAFYIFALYSIRQADRAYRLLRQMLPGPDPADILQRGQMPVFIPNYYRGAWREHPRTAGRSSQLFNTGSASWFYRNLVEGLFGIRGGEQGLRVDPQLPQEWSEAQIQRDFRGARFDIRFRREPGQREMCIRVDGKVLQGQVITTIERGARYRVEVALVEAGG